jgi:TPP-dependent pyruvate/acetoin dehydrogenase alpha subunit
VDVHTVHDRQIERLRKEMIANGGVSVAEADAALAAARKEVDEAVAFARQSPYCRST